MKIFVFVKWVVDYNVKVCVKFDQMGVDFVNVKMFMNFFCEIVVEEVICLKEKGVVIEIIVVFVGLVQVQEIICIVFVMGVDCGILVQIDDIVELLVVVKVFKVIVGEENLDVVLFGK